MDTYVVKSTQNSHLSKGKDIMLEYDFGKVKVTHTNIT